MVYCKHILFCPHGLFEVTFEHMGNRNAYDCLPLIHRITYGGLFTLLMYKAAQQFFNDLCLANLLICNIIKR